MAYALKIGDYLIRDILNPKASEIDLGAIDSRLRLMHRFSNDPKALTVHQHQHLVATLAIECNEPRDVVDWCLHHDDHESVIGDIPGPLKNLIREYTGILNTIERKLDNAISIARTGIPKPPISTYRKVHVYDKMAEAIEWVYVLQQAPETWNANIPFVPEQVRVLLDSALRSAASA